jgi:hypothetical protein
MNDFRIEAGNTYEPGTSGSDRSKEGSNKEKKKPKRLK